MLSTWYSPLQSDAVHLVTILGGSISQQESYKGRVIFQVGSHNKVEVCKPHSAQSETIQCLQACVRTHTHLLEGVVVLQISEEGC